MGAFSDPSFISAYTLRRCAAPCLSFTGELIPGTKVVTNYELNIVLLPAEIPSLILGAISGKIQYLSYWDNSTQHRNLFKIAPNGNISHSAILITPKTFVYNFIFMFLMNSSMDRKQTPAHHKPRHIKSSK